MNDDNYDWDDDLVEWVYVDDWGNDPYMDYSGYRIQRPIAIIRRVPAIHTPSQKATEPVVEQEDVRVICLD